MAQDGRAVGQSEGPLWLGLAGPRPAGTEASRDSL